MTHSSLRLRLLIAWAVFIALTLQVAGIGLRVLFERSITRRTQAELEADLRQLRRGMEVSPAGEIRIVREPTDPQFDIVFGGRYWQIDEGAATLLRSRSLATATLVMPKNLELGDASKSVKLIGPEDQHLFAVVRKHQVPAPDPSPRRTLIITTAVDALEIEEDTDKFANDLFSSLAGLAALLLLGAWAHVTIGLQPLEELRSKVAAIRAGKASVLDGQFPDEVMPLVSETNALIEAQDKAVTSARERAGDLAHGLNTPLAVMAAKARELRRREETEIADEIDRQVEKMRRHVDRELARARARGAHGAGQAPVDVARLLREIVAAIQSLPRGQELDWTLDVPQELSVPVDADDFNNIAGNLMENAQKWARSEVRVTARDETDNFALVIEDNGDGIAGNEIDRVLLRGERADTTVGGSGLGLAIVSDLVELYGGRLSLSRSSLGGLKASVRLPARV